MVAYLASRFVTTASLTNRKVWQLVTRHLPLEEPIDLLNVAFENPRKIRVRAELKAIQSHTNNKRRRQVPPNNEQEYSYLVPDRITGLEELGELRALCPGRQWNFVSVYGFFVHLWVADIWTGRNKRIIWSKLYGFNVIFSFPDLCIGFWTLGSITGPINCGVSYASESDSDGPGTMQSWWMAVVLTGI